MLHESIKDSVSSLIKGLAAGDVTSFVTLLIIVAAICIIAVAAILLSKRAKEKADVPAETIAVIPSAEEAPAPIPEEAPASDDTAIVAAIIAAISAHTGKAPTSFRVVSFKRRH